VTTTLAAPNDDAPRATRLEANSYPQYSAMESIVLLLLLLLLLLVLTQ
jgi:hypothetical protein